MTGVLPRPTSGSISSWRFGSWAQVLGAHHGDELRCAEAVGEDLVVLLAGQPSPTPPSGEPARWSARGSGRGPERSTRPQVAVPLQLRLAHHSADEEFRFVVDAECRLDAFGAGRGSEVPASTIFASPEMTPPSMILLNQLLMPGGGRTQILASCGDASSLRSGKGLQTLG